MILSEWTMVLITVLITIGGFAGRIWLKSFIDGQVKARIEEKLEKLRGEIRQSEELFKSDLRAKELEISTLQSGALHGRTSRKALTDKSRLEAVNQLWLAVTKLSKMTLPAMTASMLKFEEVAKRAAKDQKMRDFLQMAGLDGFEDKMVDAQVDELRIHLPDFVWALFSAYSLIVIGGYLQLKILSMGLENPQDLIKRDGAATLLKSVLPNRSSYIDNIGPSGYFHLLDEIKESIMVELKSIIDGSIDDKENLSKAAEIMKQVAALRQQDSAAALQTTTS